jgi:wyosine [tRNA(Phe)-imidazoG37] synthetase (radical SAM superfamily)
MIAFGPIPSRRLGRSLGVNNIPPKICSYSCIYCQIGETRDIRSERDSFYEPQAIFDAVSKKVAECRARGEAIDYLSFVPDGEPTLDRNLGKEIELLKPLGIPIAVITNGSLMAGKDVREELKQADWVCIKIDAVSEGIWRKVNRPHDSLTLRTVLRGMKEFAAEYAGVLTTQTMFIKGCNDSPEEIESLAEFTESLKPAIAYLSIPTRPPAFATVEPASGQTMNCAYQTFAARGITVELVTGYERGPFPSSGRIEQDILGITSVHPMREDSVQDMLDKAGKDWSVIRSMLDRGLLIEVEYMGSRFYLRNLDHPGG